MDYDIAVYLIAKKFSELHPKETLLEWFYDATTVTGKSDKIGIWSILHLKNRT